MRVFLCLSAIAMFLGNTSAGTLPSFIKPCSASDPNLNQCVEKVIAAAGAKFANGIPELGIRPLDPVELGRVVVNNPALKITFDDTVVTGLGGFRINSYKIQPEKGKAVLDFTANVTLKARYVMDGQVLILPIKGDGQAKIKITNLNIVIKYDFKTVDGHWLVTGHKDSYKMDGAQFKFTNLFNGNKDLADTTLKFLNENWSIIMQEIAPPAIDQILHNCVEKVKMLFAAVPAAELLTQ
ncbi:circadian clock-controlled protein daywake-like [Pararge aegeria]|uniref:Jg2018 protein n=1 Tax=Pararge aegeria aegeria TaxID=348720 RepID=A0A8S4S9M9_9NEOP|nr:circadian clock-controlled protein daywake-like [Pararge aegeria]CAH2252410.1 jg2018 [Pararge aegeria aegeria]